MNIAQYAGRPRRIYSGRRGMYGGAPDSFEHFVRSLDPVAWYPPGIGVVGGLTVSEWSDYTGKGHHLLQAAAGNRPFNLPHSGTDYAWLSGEVGNGFSTPASASTTLTGDMSVVVRVALSAATLAGVKSLGGQLGQPGTYNWQFHLGTDKLNFQYSPDGTANTTIASTITVGAAGITADTVVYIGAYQDVDNDAGGNDVKFFWSVDGASWTQIGATVTTAGTANRHASTYPLKAFCIINEIIPCEGKGYLFRVYEGNAFDGSGTLKAELDPSTFAETSTNGATAVASTGETWTLNSTGGYPTTIVKSPQILFGGVDEYLKTAAFTLNQPSFCCIVFKPITFTNVDFIFDGATTNSMVLRQNGATPAYSTYAGGGADSIGVGPALGALGIVSATYNGALSPWRLNLDAPNLADIGTANASGLTLGADGGLAFGFGNFIAKEFIAFPVAPTEAQLYEIVLGLNARHRCF